MMAEDGDRDATARTERQDDDAPIPALFPSNVTRLRSIDRKQKLRMIEALLFAAATPLDEAVLASHLTEGEDVPALLAELQGMYAGRGINLIRVAGKWTFRTADDLGFLLERHQVEQKRLSRPALETLAIIAYHQPVTRAEIEEIRGVSISKGTLDLLLEIGWVRLRGRKRVAGRPLTYGITDAFLAHFGLDSTKDLPGVAELKGMGLLDSAPAGAFGLQPAGIADPAPDEDNPGEDPLEDGDPALGTADTSAHDDGEKPEPAPGRAGASD